MTGGAGEFPQRPSLDGGELLLRLLQSHQRSPQQSSPSSSLSPQTLSIDPAVAAVGPAVTGGASRRDRHNSAASNHSVSPPPNFLPLGFHHHQSPPCPPPQQQFFPMAPHQHFDLHGRQYQPEARDEKVVFGNFSFPLRNEDTLSNSNSLENNRENSSSKMGFLRERELGFGVGSKRINGFDLNRGIDPRFDLGPQRPTKGVYGSPEVRPSGPPPGFSSKPGNHRGDMGYSVGRQMGGSIERRHRGNSSNSKGYERDRRERRSAIGDSESSCSSGGTGVRLSRQMERPGPPSGSTLHSASASEIEESLLKLQAAVVDNGEGSKARSRSGDGNGVGFDEVDELSEQLVDSVLREDEVEEKNDTKKKHFRRDRDFRSDARGKWILPQRMRNVRRLIGCRRDIDRLNAAFIAIYESLVPPEEEKAKQKQLLTLLEKLVRKEWPNAELYLYGSCANSFGVSKSDIDVCLAIDDQNIDKSEVLLKLADILQSDNLQNVQALTRARVPIVKLMDPVTGISCDICINNVLAVVNTKLLRDYAKIDVRLRQLAFIVKHWAKSRAVNETYQGTLSSYAYVLMCIHFLQQCRPPILPCLQEMEATYSVTIDDVECAYFDKVDRLRDFGARNRESIAQLVWEFFHYWAYCHDYANSVISVRAGTTLSKQAKDWTRRIGNDRHLICIEDPFETSHDLGRVVDKRSIRVLREEFERAAEILQCDPNPCFRLFERYPPKNPSLT